MGPRDYFRDFDQRAAQWSPFVNRMLMYACLAVGAITVLLPGVGPLVVKAFGASFYSSLQQFRVWQLFTYAFVHSDLWHLLFNMLGMYFFGGRLEDRWGPDKYLRFAVVTIVGAALVHLLLGSFMPGARFGFLIGISGLVYGQLFAVAHYYPNDTVLLYGIVPMRMRTLAIGLGVITLLQSYSYSVSAGGGSVAHLAHLGGAVFAWLFIKYPAIFGRIPMPRISRLRRVEKFPDPRDRWRKF